MNYAHPELAAGKWQSLSLFNQLGNAGSEVSRARIFEQKNPEQFKKAIFRALELLDLTIQDPKNRPRLKEICRAREVLTDVVFGDNQYKTTLADLDQYFTQFAIAARLKL